MANVINWFEIPAKNFDRACAFYKNVLGEDLHVIDMPGGGKMAMLPGHQAQQDVGGAIVHAEGYEPSSKGAVVYLNGGKDLSVFLARVEKAGGKVTVPKMPIGQNGFIAHFTDSEGNRVAFHSMN